MMRREVTAGPWQSEKINRRRGVLIRLIMFESAHKERFCENIIQSYQTTGLIELRRHPAPLKRVAEAEKSLDIMSQSFVDFAVL